MPSRHGERQRESLADARRIARDLARVVVRARIRAHGRRLHAQVRGDVRRRKRAAESVLPLDRGLRPGHDAARVGRAERLDARHRSLRLRNLVPVGHPADDLRRGMHSRLGLVDAPRRAMVVARVRIGLLRLRRRERRVAGHCAAKRKVLERIERECAVARRRRRRACVEPAAVCARVAVRECDAARRDEPCERGSVDRLAPHLSRAPWAHARKQSPAALHETPHGRDLGGIEVRGRKQQHIRIGELVGPVAAECTCVDPIGAKLRRRWRTNDDDPGLVAVAGEPPDCVRDEAGGVVACEHAVVEVAVREQHHPAIAHRRRSRHHRRRIGVVEHERDRLRRPERQSAWGAG